MPSQVSLPTMRSYVLWCLLFLTGIASQHVAPAPLWLWFVLCCSTLVGFFYLRWRGRQGAILLLCFASYTTGGLSLATEHHQRFQSESPHLHSLLGTKYWYEGRWSAPIQEKKHGQRGVFVLARFSPSIRGPWRPIHGRIRLQLVSSFAPSSLPTQPPHHPRSIASPTTSHPPTHRTPQKPTHRTRKKTTSSPRSTRSFSSSKRPLSRLTSGTWIRVALRLRPPRWYGNPGAWDARKSLARQSIRWQASARLSRILRLRAPTPSWNYPLLRWRQQLQEWIQHTIPSPSARPLLQALLLGDKSELTPSLRNAFARTGTAHLLAISGLHLAIVCSLAWFLFVQLFRWLPFCIQRAPAHRWALFPTWFILLLYTTISGASLSTQRAFCMLSLVLLASGLERRVEIANTLATAAFLVLLAQPSALVSLSFQLSFGAVSLLAWSVTGLQRWLTSFSWLAQSSRLTRFLRWILAGCLASFITTTGLLPFTLAAFPHVPWTAPFVNLLAIPIGGYGIVGIGLLALFLYPLSPFLATYVLRGSGWIATQFTHVLQSIAQLPWVCWEAPPLRPLETFGVIALVAALGCARSRNQLRRPMLLLFLVGGMCWLPTFLPESKPQPLALHFLDIGQGDATFIRFPNGTTMLVDAGGEPFLPFDVGKHVLLPYFRWLRLARLDYAVLSHPHPDHFGGFPSLFQRYPPREFWHNAETGHHPQYRKLQQTLHQKHIQTRTFSQPWHTHIGQVRLDILHPFPGPYEGKTYYWALHANDNSLVLLLTYKHIRILLTGDIEQRAEQILTQRWPHLRADLIKVPHHGSRTSSTATLLDHVQPRHAVACLGRINTFGFPHPPVLQRYRKRRIKFWRTDQSGRILVTTHGHKLHFHTHYNTPPIPQPNQKTTTPSQLKQ